MEGETQKINHGEGSRALKKMIPQLLISVSLFSFLISYSTSLSTFSSSPKFQRHFFSFSFSFNKNCLFLICNGLLVFLSKTSGIIHPPSAHEYLNDDLLHFKTTDAAFHRSYDDEFHQNNINVGVNNPAVADQVSIFIAESDQPEEDVIKKDDHQNQPICWLFQDDDDDDGEHLYGDHDDDDDDDDDHEEEEEEEEEEGEEEEMMMSTEELNKKFEDFIRKMKEEIIINEASYSHMTDKLLLLN